MLVISSANRSAFCPELLLSTELVPTASWCTVSRCRLVVDVCMEAVGHERVLTSCWGLKQHLERLFVATLGPIWSTLGKFFVDDRICQVFFPGIFSFAPHFASLHEGLIHVASPFVNG